MPPISSLRPVQILAGDWKRLVTLSNCIFAIWIGLWTLPLATSSPNPHQPVQQRWQIINPTGQEVWSISHTAPLWTWWPSLHPDICQLAIGLPSWDIPDVEDPTKIPSGTRDSGTFGCSSPQARCRLASLDYYVCPAGYGSHEQSQLCGGQSDFYCKSWGCEQTGAAWWEPDSPDSFIRVGRNSTRINPESCPSPGPDPEDGVLALNNRCHSNTLCNPLNITFTPKGKGYTQSWISGNTYGMRFYTSGYDFGLWFTIRLKRQLNPTAIGPNLLKPGIRPPKSPMPQFTTPSKTKVPPPSNTQTPLPSTSPIQGEASPSYWGLIEGAFAVLNSTQPDLTQSCWLCLSTTPPYYEGIAINGTYTVKAQSSSCSWGENPKLTLPEVTGAGLCLGSPPKSKQHLCTQIKEISTTQGFLIPENGTWWACDSGLTPCISAQVFNSSVNYCVMVQMFPRVLYHDAGSFEHQIGGHTTRFRREPVSLTLAIQEPLTSLSEVVLQNRRESDLLFMREGGLCAALREECCFYADHTGVVRESMSKLRKRLEERQRKIETQQRWFESWFTQSPWLIMLLIILMLLLTVGLCLLNRFSRLRLVR